MALFVIPDESFRENLKMFIEVGSDEAGDPNDPDVQKVWDVSERLTAELTSGCQILIVGDDDLPAFRNIVEVGGECDDEDSDRTYMMMMGQFEVNEARANCGVTPAVAQG